MARGQYWSYSFRSDNERLTRQAPAHVNGSTEPAGDHPCARAEWCSAATRERSEDGTTVRTPAKAYQAFCHSDRSIILNCLNALPATYARLGDAIGDHMTGEIVVHVDFGPSVEIRTDIDEIQRTVVDSVMVWWERVAAVAGLAVTEGRDDTEAWRARALGPFAASLLAEHVPVLAGHLDALLALEAGPMLRPAMVASLGCGTPEAVDPVRCEARSSAGLRCVHDRHELGTHMDRRGREWPLTDTVLLSAGGPEAGNEMLRLDYIARASMLETSPDQDQLLGVACENCGRRSLRRAAPPQHDGDPLFYSSCDACHQLATSEEYAAWTARLTRFYAGRVTPAVRAASGLRGDESEAIAAAVGVSAAALVVALTPWTRLLGGEGQAGHGTARHAGVWQGQARQVRMTSRSLPARPGDR